MRQTYATQQTRMPDDQNSERIPSSDPRSEVISIDPERVSGTPCFVGTRVPIQDLWDYLAGGDSRDVFLDSFPTVSREQAVRVIQMASAQLLEGLPTK